MPEQAAGPNHYPASVSEATDTKVGRVAEEKEEERRKEKRSEEERKGGRKEVSQLTRQGNMCLERSVI